MVSYFPNRECRIHLVAAVVACFTLCSALSADDDPGKAKGAGNKKPPKWTILFRSNDPSIWDTDSEGKDFAISLRKAPEEFRYLRLRRMDTGEAQILRIGPNDLNNGKPPSREVGYWWNGSAKLDWKGRHLGIVEAPRNQFPAPRGMMCVMSEGWDCFTGSGFAHKCSFNDAQYYCWRGKQIKKTVFEIAVSDGPLDEIDKLDLLGKK
jgi:hypothetical protein